MTRIFLTGGTGFIGQHLTPLLLENGYDVSLLIHRKQYAGPHHPNLSTVQGDIRDPNSLYNLLEKVDAIIHLAGSISETTLYRYIKYNAETTQLLAETASRFPSIKQFIYISSQAAAGPSKPGHPISEVHSANPVSEYGKSKLMAESRLLLSPGNFQKTIIRPPVVYGPGDPSFLTIFQVAHHQIRPIIRHGIQELSLIHVADLCSMIVGLLLNPRLTHDDIFFVNDGKDIHTVDELFTLLQKATGKRGIPLPIPIEIMAGSAYFLELIGTLRGKAPLYNMSKYKELKQPSWCCKSEKILGFLEYTIKYPLEIGLKDTYTWYRQHRWL
ncbi:MAG: NAD(P)-dependent oxidoreductase [Candidatus Marinimicrobia bacterium]|nr:NAD(P)-dependent oxidoreductase [Candidatus Neomarinimicrobiota bacterium]MDD5581648.1 NAD(P)-dependent oxidoreductase [Candidatus Neomarinimicrobiota bacterium]